MIGGNCCITSPNAHNEFSTRAICGGLLLEILRLLSSHR